MLCSPLHAYRVQTKVFKEACSDLTDSLTKKVNTAAFEEAKKRLKDVFGFELAMIPENQVQNLSKTYQNRYYVLNKVQEDGTHSKIMHSVHTSSSVEKGLLMLVLALCYCRGETRQGHRWFAVRCGAGLAARDPGWIVVVPDPSRAATYRHVGRCEPPRTPRRAYRPASRH